MLLKVENGQFPIDSGRVYLNCHFWVLFTDFHQLIINVYPDFYELSNKTLSWFQERAILIPTNENVEKINNLVLEKFHAPI